MLEKALWGMCIKTSSVTGTLNWCVKIPQEMRGIIYQWREFHFQPL
jgi:hypothetical protein